MEDINDVLSLFGTLVSLTDKSDVRYEGLLTQNGYNLSSVALRNAKHCGTEGRRINGPQIPPSGRSYSWLCFPISEIKGLESLSAPDDSTPVALPNGHSVTEDLKPRDHVENTEPISNQTEVCDWDAVVGPNHARRGIFVTDEVLIEKLKELLELMKAKILGPGTTSNSNDAQGPGPGS